MPVDPLATNNRMQVLVMEDARRKSFLSIEPVRQADGCLRLFKEASGSGFSTDEETIGRVNAFLNAMPADRLIFEDTRKSLLAKLLKKCGYRKVVTYNFLKGGKVSWPSWDGRVPEKGLFGVADGWQLQPGYAFRRLSLSDRSGAVGEIAFTDFGRFVRAKANEFGSEGFGFVRDGRSPSSLLLALVGELLKERKRYLILGPEYSDHVGPVHPFPLWHMSSSSQRSYDHRCRVATGTDLKAIAKLVSEYEDLDAGAALTSVTNSFYNPAFRFILPPEGGGFSLIKFMENAQGMVNDLYVTPARQGKGVGDELTRASLSMLAESCLTIRLNTIYPRARRLYEKYGFKVVYEDLCVALRQSTMARAGGGRP
jgi:GNAT superfamily N-acetyltransferase